MPCPFCWVKMLIFSQPSLPSLPEGQVQRESCETPQKHPNASPLGEDYGEAGTFGLGAQSLKDSQHSAGHMLPRAQVRPLLGGRVGFEVQAQEGRKFVS